MNKKLLIVLLFILVLSVSGWAQETRVLKRYYAIPQTALTNEDIMKLFVNEVRTYLQRYDRIGSYYFVHYGVEQNKELQNDAWHTDTIEFKYQWGTVYQISLGISNAWFQVKFCNTAFNVGGQSAQQITTTQPERVGGQEIRKHIVDTAVAMFQESRMVRKMFNYDYSEEARLAFFQIVNLYE